MALGLYNHLHRGKLNIQKLLISYSIFVIFINLCVFMALIYLFGNQEITFINKGFIIYIVLASLFSLIIPFVANLIENSVAVEVKKNEKK